MVSGARRSEFLELAWHLSSLARTSQAVFGGLHRTSWQFTGKVGRKWDGYWSAVWFQGRSRKNVRDTDVFLTFKC